MDNPNVNYGQSRYKDITTEASNFLKKAGFKKKNI